MPDSGGKRAEKWDTQKGNGKQTDTMAGTEYVYGAINLIQ